MDNKKIMSVVSVLSNVNNDIDGVHSYLNDLYKKQGGSLNQIGATSLSHDIDKLSDVQQLLRKQLKN